PELQRWMRAPTRARAAARRSRQSRPGDRVAVRRRCGLREGPAPRVRSRGSGAWLMTMAFAHLDDASGFPTHEILADPSGDVCSLLDIMWRWSVRRSRGTAWSRILAPARWVTCI